jgi:hypothetical protein
MSGRRQTAPDADTWQPRPGTTKRQCAHCGEFFATTGGSTCAPCLARRHLRNDGTPMPPRAKRREK